MAPDLSPQTESGTVTNAALMLTTKMRGAMYTKRYEINFQLYKLV